MSVEKFFKYKGNIYIPEKTQDYRVTEDDCSACAVSVECHEFLRSQAPKGGDAVVCSALIQHGYHLKLSAVSKVETSIDVRRSEIERRLRERFMSYFNAYVQREGDTTDIPAMTEDRFVNVVCDIMRELESKGRNGG